MASESPDDGSLLAPRRADRRDDGPQRISGQHLGEAIEKAGESRGRRGEMLNANLAAPVTQRDRLQTGKVEGRMYVAAHYFL